MIQLYPVVLAALSERQAEVAELFINGYKQKEIAAKLDIALRTVKTHFGHLFRLAEIPVNPRVCPLVQSQILLARALLCK